MPTQWIIKQLLFLLFALGWLQMTLSSSNNDPYHRILSRGKPVVQSSTEGDHVASLATDGNYKDDPESECAKTQIQTNPYLEVDLEEDMFINALVLSLPIVEQEYSNMKVTIKNADSSLNKVLVNTKTIFNKFVLSPKETARYIRIERIQADAQLAMCEVAVYNIPIENIAARKPTEASKQISHGNKHNAVDYSINSRLMTKKESNPWFRVILEDVYFVHDVFLIALVENSPYQKPMLDFNLRIGNSEENNGNSNPLCTTASLWMSEARTFFCDMFGKLINIHRPGKDVALQLAEVLVNTENAESIVAKTAVGSKPKSTSEKRFPLHAVDRSGLKWYKIGLDTYAEKWLRVELGAEYNIVMIYIYASKLKEFELKLGLSTDFALQGHCVPGLHDMEKSYHSEHFFCVERTPATYIHIHQYPKDNTFEVGEVAAYEETKPVINYVASDKYAWGEEHKDTTLTCDIKGYPTPVFSWIKNKKLLATGSTSLTLLHVRRNESGTYECWGNNTHGYNAKWVELRVASKLRVCADHEEIKYDLKTSSVVKDFEIRGDQWYSSFDYREMKYLQFKEKAPKSTSCQLWLNRKHPKLQDGIVQGTMCVKNNTHDCAATIDVDIRRCAAYYVYHFRSLRSTSKYQFCFEPATISTSGQQPAISAPIANYALSSKTFQTETEVAEPSQCLVMCQLETRCKSFNFSKKDKICELNKATKKTSPKNYGPKMGYSYYQMSGGAMKVVRGGEL